MPAQSSLLGWSPNLDQSTPTAQELETAEHDPDDSKSSQRIV